MADAHPLIAVRDVAYRYNSDGRSSLSNANLGVGQGELLLLTGRSGCGKTTLTRCINGLIPHFYEGLLSGRVRVDGIDPSQVPIHETALRVGSVFQDPRSQFFTTNTTDEIAFGLENVGTAREVMRERIAETAVTLGIESLLERGVFRLSSGEKQKVALASIYAMRPPVLLLDEPSANIDLAAIAQLKDMLRTLKRDGHTIIVVEHRLYYLRDLVDRIVYMDRGRVTDTYTPGEFGALPESILASKGLRAFDLGKVSLRDDATPAPGGKCVLQVDGLSVVLPNNKRILQDIHLAVHAGEILGIVGENGAGKTTLIRTICGLQKETLGSVIVNGRRMRRNERIKHSYLVMQDVDYQLFADSVENELSLGNADAMHVQARVTAALEALSLEPYRAVHPSSLSGGEKQRVVIAAAMVQDSSVICFDEPTSGLDGDSMNRVSAVLCALRDRGKAVLVISHDYEFLVRTCSRVVRLRGGRLVDDYALDSASAPKLTIMNTLRG